MIHTFRHFFKLFNLEGIEMDGPKKCYGFSPLLLDCSHNSVTDLKTVRSCCCVVVQSLSRVWLFVTPWIAAHQAPLSFIISRSLLKFMSLELVMLSNHLVFCHPFSFCLQSFPTSGSFPVSQIFTSGGQSVGALASASVLPMNIQGWLPSGLTGLISLQSSRLSRVITSIKTRKHQFFGAQPSLWLNPYNCT